jgi:preprotein translocase subunit YajC
MVFLWWSPLLAEGEAANQGSPLAGMLFPMVLIVLVWYFLILRPQGRERRQREQTLNNLKRNDRVVTYAGIIGTITGFSDDNKEVTLRVDDGVKLRFLRSAIQGLIAEPPASTDPSKPATN